MTDPRRSFVEELKRRRVPRVAIVYLATAFAVIEAADVLAPSLGLPEWTVSFVFALALLGFPVALVMAWAFQLTADGVRSEDPASLGAAEPAGWVSARTVVGACVLVVVGLAGGWLAGRGGGASESPPDEVAATVSVGVLPFADMTPEQDGEYFSDGLAEEILNLLARVDGLKVPARTSSFAFKGRNLDVRAIADSLDVSTVLEGSVRSDGGRVRVTAQLIQASDGYHLWSETYDRELRDIFALQEDVAREIVAALEAQLGLDASTVTARSAPTEDLEAYQLFLQARHLFHQRTEASLPRSAELYEQALDLDPEFAEAWVGLAMTYAVIPGYTDVEYDASARATEAAERGLALDPELALGHAVLGNLTGDYGRNWVAVSELYSTALELDPRDPTILLWSGTTDLTSGRLRAGRASIENAFAIDPVSGVINGWMGHLAWLRGDADGAIAAYRRSIELSWGAGPVWLCTILTISGRTVEAAESCDRYAADAGRDTDLFESLRAYREGRIGIDQLLTGRPLWGTLIAPVAADDTAFFAALDALLASPGASALPDVAMWGVQAADFRADPRFVQWVEAAELPDYWDAAGWPDACARNASGTIVCG